MLEEEQELASIIDYEADTGVFGHSMGGAATVCAASDADSVSSGKIAAAVAMHPGVQTGPSVPMVPILFTTGSSDSICGPVLVRPKYNKAPAGVAHSYAVFKGYTHFSSTGAGD